MLKSRFNVNKLKGFTLVELMVAITISSIIMLGVVSLYSASRKGQKTNESLARIQENLRFAADMISKDIRMAGYAGCTSSSISNVLDADATGVYDFQNHITGYEGGVSAFPAQFPVIGASAGDRIANTDAIAILRVASQGCKVVSHTAGSATIFLDAAACNIEEDEVVSITDCNQTSIFRVTGPASLPASNNIVHNTGAVGNGPKNCSQNLGPNVTPRTGTGCVGTFASYSYGQDARVHKYIMHAYFIGNSTSGKTTSLYVVNLDKGVTSATELVEGIEDFQITYGVDTDADGFPERFIKASDSGMDFTQIVAVKFGMLLTSINDVKQVAPPTAKSFTLVDTTVAPGPDQKLRFSYNTTVKIRNKGIR